MRLPIALALVATSVPAAFAEDGESYDKEPVVFAQRRLVMAPNLIRPELSFFVGQYGADADTTVGFGVVVDWTPIDKLQIGAVASPVVAPETDAGEPGLYARYLFLDGAFQLAGQIGYNYQDPGPGVIGLAVPMRFDLNPAAHLDLHPGIGIDLPDSGEKTYVDLEVDLGLGISFTRALYMELSTGLSAPQFDFDLASVPLGLELGYSIKGAEETAWIDIFLRANFDAFLLPNAPEGSDTVNLDVWTIALGGRATFGLD